MLVARAIALQLCAACLGGLPAPAAPANDQASDQQMSQCAGEHDETADEMIAACTGAIESGRLDPKELALAYTLRAEGYQRKDELDRALADAEKAIQLDPTSARAFHRRGDLYKIKRQSDLALADFTEAIRLDPTMPIYFINRSNIYLDKHQYDLAVGDLDAALRLDPNDELESIVNRCNVLTFKGDFTAALADCQKGVKQWPQDPYPLSRLGFLYFKMDKLDDSLAAYDAALAAPDLGSYDPYEKAYPPYGRGLTKLKKGDKAGGEADLAAAKALTKDIERDFE